MREARVSGDDDDEQRAEAVIRHKVVDDMGAILVGQQHIQQDDLRFMRRQQMQRLFAIARFEDVIVPLTQYDVVDIAQRGFILYNQCERTHGRSRKD